MEAAPPPPPKLRLMCSYGGHILPRPRTNSLFYAGGDTRIVSVDRRTVTTLSTLLSHLSAVLSLSFPFTLKYQLPNLDLDALISLSSDEDFHILIYEHDRISSSSRLRLFVFPSPPPKIDSWFFDALKSSGITQNDAVIDLDTSSSFGSTSSSTSFSNLPPIRPHFSSSDSLPSDNTVSSIMSHHHNISYQDPVVHVESVEVESKNPYFSSGVMPNNANVNMGYSSLPRFNQMERPNVQFAQAARHFLPLHTTALNPIPLSGHHTYQQPRPLHHVVYDYHPNQLCPVYLVPVGNMPPNNFPVTAATQVSLHQNASSINYHVAQNSVVGTRPAFAHGFTSQCQNYITENVNTSFIHLPYNGTQEPERDTYPIHHHQSQSQNIAVDSSESPKCANELDNDLAHVQIYKSQPPPPKYQTMNKATTNLLSEALAKLHVDNLKPQTETSQPESF